MLSRVFAMDLFVSRDRPPEPARALDAPGREMRVSKLVAAAGPKNKKKGKKRAEGVMPQLVEEPKDGRKRAKRKDRTEYLNAQRAMKMVSEYPDQSLEERDGLLWCVACNTSLKFNEVKSIKQHLYGQRQKGVDSQKAFAEKSVEEKMKLGHYVNLVELQKAEKHTTMVEKATSLSPLSGGGTL